MVGERPEVVVLVGMMGSGKSTTGQMLARRLGVQFCDTDERVQRNAGLTIARLFADRGEAAFREEESVALGQCLDEGGVVATGGGIVLREANRVLLSEAGIRVAWLDAQPTGLAARLDGVVDRPLLGDNPQAALAALDHQRRPLYAQVASFCVDTTNKSPDAVCDELEAWVRSLR